MPCGADAGTQTFRYTEKHLELVRGLRHLQFADQTLCFSNEMLIVRGNPDVNAGTKQALQSLKVVAIDLGHFLIRNVLRLHVHALA
jgi:hypothetical protein